MKRAFVCIVAVLCAMNIPCMAQEVAEHTICNKTVTGAVGIALEYDSTVQFSVTAGTSIHFSLRARNENLDIVKNWDQVGKDVTLTVRGSHAETDSSKISWNNRSRAFTWLSLQVNGTMLYLDSLSDDREEVLLHYTIPKSEFTNGQSSLTFAQSGADTGVVLSIAPEWQFLQQHSPPITVRPDHLDNFLIQITSQTENPDQIYLLRRYEIVVTPRDRYLNPWWDSEVTVKFSARFPGEFDQNQPGLDDVFVQESSLNGPTAFMLASRISRPYAFDTSMREMQWISVHAIDDSTIIGRSNPFDILNHPPYEFFLQEPPDSTEIELRAANDLERFTWTKAFPQDPYTDIRVSRFDSVKVSDEITYKVRFLDAGSMTRAVEFDADNGGEDTVLTVAHKTLYQMVDQLYRLPRENSIIWYVEATDGLYITESTPIKKDPMDRDGHCLIIDRPITPGVSPIQNTRWFSLFQNYPNPFNPSTTIPVELRGSGYCTIRVFNVVGEMVAVLHEGFLTAGQHRFGFDGSGLPSGVYSYRLEMDGSTLNRSMLLLR